jgi:UPF0271 protein
MKKDKKKAVFILDTSAFLSGRPLDFENVVLITTSSIENEINPGGRDYQNLQYLKEIGLILKKPTSESKKKIQTISKKTGDYERLSDFDKEILALALDEQKLQPMVIILTDDYSIQNIASSLKIMFKSIIQEGITKKFKWITRCSGCGKKFKDNISICPICGSETKKTVHKTEEIKE